MKKSLGMMLIPLLMMGCRSSEQHHYIVISNDYKDTCEVVAEYWRTERVRLYSNKGYNDTDKTVTIFASKDGASQVYNVNKIIAKEKTK